MALADGETLSLLFGAGTQGTEEHFNSQGAVSGQRKSSGNERIALFLCLISSSNPRSPVRVSQRLLRSVKPSWGIKELAALGRVLREAYFPFRAAGGKLERTTGPAICEYLSGVTAKSRKQGAE